jgi:hypothetical protein
MVRKGLGRAMVPTGARSNPWHRLRGSPRGWGAKVTQYVTAIDTSLSSYNSGTGRLERLHAKAGEGSPVDVVVEREEPVTAPESMGAYEKIREDAARAGIDLLSLSRDVGLEGVACRAPNTLI